MTWAIDTNYVLQYIDYRLCRMKPVYTWGGFRKELLWFNTILHSRRLSCKRVFAFLGRATGRTTAALLRECVKTRTIKLRQLATALGDPTTNGELIMDNQGELSTGICQHEDALMIPIRGKRGILCLQR